MEIKRKIGLLLMENKKISVIIPAYNIEGYIARCIECVKEQTYKNLEIIVVDDGSKDNTPQILDEIAKTDDRIVVIHKENEGVSVARNTGIEKATGEYFFFFDGDDFFEKNTIEKIYFTALEKDVDTVIYGYYRYENDAVKEKCLPRFDRDMYLGEEIIKELVPAFIGLSYDNINDFIAHKEGALYVENPALWRCMVNADIVRKNNLTFKKGLKVGEDTVFISEYLSCSEKCFVLQECFYYLVTRETSTIFVYEKNPLAKLNGKLDLLTARAEMTERVLGRTGVDLKDTWQGTVIMSVIELAFLLSQKNPEISWGERYKIWGKYWKEKQVKEAVKGFKMKLKPSIIAVPFIFLKLGLYPVLFLAVTVLNKIGYSFKRS